MDRTGNEAQWDSGAQEDSGSKKLVTVRSLTRSRGLPGGSDINNLPAMWETWG